MSTTKVSRKPSEMAEALMADSLSVRGGVYTYRKMFFYTNGQTAQSHADKIKRIYPDCTILEQEEIWKPFRGNAPLARSSHFMVKFAFTDHKATSAFS